MTNLETETIQALDDLAVKLPPLLGPDWTEAKVAGEHTWQRCLIINGPDGARMRLAIIQESRKPARVAVDGFHPEGWAGLGSGPKWTCITVALDRGPESIAREITRRFIPGYLSAFRDQAERVQRHNAFEAGRVAAATRVARILGKLKPDYWERGISAYAKWTDPTQPSEWKSHTCHLYIEVGTPTDGSIRITGAPLPLLEEMARLFQTTEHLTAEQPAKVGTP